MVYFETFDDVYNHVKESVAKNYDLKLLDPLGFNNTYTLAMEEGVAEKYNIKTYSDLVKYSDEFVKERGRYNLKQPLDCNSISYSASLDYPITHDGITYYPGSD